MRQSPVPKRIAIALGAALLAVTGCGGASDLAVADGAPPVESVAPRPTASPEARRAVAEVLSRASRIGAPGVGGRAFDDIVHLLRNFRLVRDGTSLRASERVVVGRVVAVEAGPGFIDGEEIADGVVTPRRKVAFDDPASAYGSVHLEVEVLEQLGSSADDARQVRVGLAVNPGTRVELLNEGFVAAESWVFFLDEGGPLFDYDPSLFASASNGRFVTEVVGDELRLAGFDKRGERYWLRTVDTLSELRKAAERPETVRRVDRYGQPE